MSQPFSARFSRLASRFQQAYAAMKRGWQQEWARGNDLDYHIGGRVHMTLAGQQSAWVFRCWQLIAGPIMSLDLEWYPAKKTGRASDQRELDDPDLLQFWNAPAMTASGRLSLGEFIELSLDWMNDKGQALWVLDDSWLDRTIARKNPIILARADRMTPIKHIDTIIGWRFLDGLGRSFNLLPQQVVRPRIPSPYDDAKGLSPLEAAWVAATGDHASGIYSRNISQANGDQGVFVVNKTAAALSEEQQAQIMAALRQKAQLAKAGEYRAMFLTSDVAIEDPKVRSVDEAFLAMRNFSRDEIAVAHGVPPSMLSLMQSYSIGSASDRYRLIEETCIPFSARLCAAFEKVEWLRSGNILNAVFDWDSNSVMAAVRNEKLTAATNAWKCGIPWDVLNANMDLRLEPFPGSDRAWLPMSLEAVSGASNDDEEETNETTQPEENNATAKTIQKQAVTIERMLKLIAAHPESRADDGVSRRTAIWKKHMQARGPSEKLFTGKIRKCLMAARAETLAKIETTEKSLAGVRERGVLDLIFDLAKFTASLVSETNKAQRSALDTATHQFLEEVARPDDPWKMEHTKVLNYLSTRDNLMRDASKEIFEQIQSSLQEGLQKGETSAELAARVRTEFNGISDERAAMIAATETGAAYGAARHDAMEGLEIPFKEWLSAQDDRVRATHLKMDGVVVSAAEPFHVPTEKGGTDLMMHPCDSGGSAENCINCRCVELPLMEEDAGV